MLLTVNSSGILTSPTSSAAAIVNVVSQFRGIDQQDAEELLQSIIQNIESQRSLDSGYDLVASENPLRGMTGSFLQCEQCNDKRSVRDVPFIDIMLTLPESHIRGNTRNSAEPYSVHDCLKMFLQTEIVEGVDCLRCSLHEEAHRARDALHGLEFTCQTLGLKDKDYFARDLDLLLERVDEINRLLEVVDETDSDLLSEAKVPILKRTFIKKLQITRAPTIMCIHLGRKYFSMQKHCMVKSSQHVAFPLQLDTQEYCSPDAYQYRIPANMSSSGSIALYSLRAVVVHHGGSNSGHYTTYRCLSASPFGQWAHVSDERSILVSTEEVLQCQAYLLFYSC